MSSLRKLALACILFASPAFAQSLLSVDVEPVAVLEGASELTPFGGKTLIKSDGELKATPAALLTFTTTETASVSVLFETSDRLPVEAEQEGRRYLVTATGRVWYYAVIVDIIDGKAVIEQKRGAFEVTPVDPPPPPLPDTVRAASESGARALGDKPTTAALITEINAALQRTRGSPNLSVVVNEIKKGIVKAIQSRPPTNVADWVGKWRAPVNDAIEKLNPASADAYRSMMGAAVQGLEDSLL